MQYFENFCSNDLMQSKLLGFLAYKIRNTNYLVSTQTIILSSGVHNSVNFQEKEGLRAYLAIDRSVVTDKPPDGQRNH